MTSKDNKPKILVWHMGYVARFYVLVRETEKSVWLQEVRSSVAQNPKNNGQVWEVKPNIGDKEGEVFRKLKNPRGQVKMREHQYLHGYDAKKPVFERDF